MAVREEPWRIKLEKNRKMRFFFSISEVWKCIFSLGIAETDRNLSKGDRDLPKSTLADAMEPEISKSVRIMSRFDRKSMFFWWSDIEDISKMEAPWAIRTVNAAQNRSQRVKRPRNRGLQGVLAKPTRLSRARAEKW